ncbi:MAG: hypothetical protein E1N59_2409 [Puniceicoccaceae bacterium 5H]|nr:MAG: hypothetical protein E1N59_2409 [Puniceicoccaceae bacterium 5H]
MNHCFCALSILAVTSLTAEAVAAGAVTSFSKRAELLQGLEQAFEIRDVPAKDAIQLESPFALPAAKQAASGPQDAAPEPPPRLNDAQAVVAVADTLKAVGSTVGLGRAFLMLEDRRSIEEGKTISATIQGQAYEVVLEEVTMSTYTLRLGSASVTRPITSITDPAKIKRSANAE